MMEHTKLAKKFNKKKNLTANESAVKFIWYGFNSKKLSLTPDVG